MFDKLKAPFPPDRISWRIGSTTSDKSRGLALAYIDARDVMERLDEVCGPDGWQCRYPHADKKTVCEIGVRVKDEWIWKADGAGDSDVEAEKGALSDAFKRAAVRWGVGRYLYDLEAKWVEIEPMGRSFRIKEHERLRLAAAPKQPVKTIGKMSKTCESLIEGFKACNSEDDILKYIQTDTAKNSYATLNVAEKKLVIAVKDERYMAINGASAA